MNVAIFKDLTTEDHLSEIEKESEKYNGLFVDMEDKKQRKFVKEKASFIGDLLKKLDRARIDKKKEYAASVEHEADNIKERLENANLPFTALIDEHKKKRAAILAAEKAKQDAIDAALKLEEDHELALMMDKSIAFDRAEKLRLQKEHEEKIAAQAREQAEQERIKAEERAEQAERDRILAEEQAKRDAVEAEKQAKIMAEQAAERAKQAEIERQAQEKAAQEEAKRKLEANKRHVGMIRGKIKDEIMLSSGIDEAAAKKIVIALCHSDFVTINY